MAADLGKPVSHGCVRISPETATLYALVAENGLENTRVVLTGVTPGGESKSASEIAPETTGHGLPLSKCEAYNRVYDQPYESR